MFPHTDRILDMFPHTGDIHNGVSVHVETVVLMSRKDTTPCTISIVEPRHPKIRF